MNEKRNEDTDISETDDEEFSEDLPLSDLSLIERARKSPLVFSVSALTRTLKQVIRSNFSAIWVKGEISDRSVSTRGNIFLTLKEETSIFPAMIFSHTALGRREKAAASFEVGQVVECLGEVSCYEKRGTYQLILHELRVVGWGDLRLAFLALRERLLAEGLFAETRKKEIPIHVEHVAILTSLGGAVLGDIVRTLSGKENNRFSLKVYDTLVQGEEAPTLLRKQLQRIIEDSAREDLPSIETIIIARGGGSLEELAPFNDEGLVRVIASCPIPIISAIGHEGDWVLSDEAADHRAATPTAAAEFLLSRRAQAILEMKDTLIRARENLHRRMEQCYTRLHVHASLRGVSQILKRDIALQKIQLERSKEKKLRALREQVYTLNEHWRGLSKLLASLAPEKMLERGYAIVRRDGKLVRRAALLTPGEGITLHFYDNTQHAVITEAKHSPPSDDS